MPGLETEYALYQTFTATANASGTATVVLGPSAAYTRWELTRYSVVAVQNDPSVNVVFTLYRGSQAQGNVIDYTVQGYGDTSAANDVNLTPGDYCTGVWSGLTPNSSASITINGSIFVRGKRSY